MDTSGLLGKEPLTLAAMITAILVPIGDVLAQSTPQPTPPPGSNSVVFSASTNEYCFRVGSDTLYKYSIEGSGNYRQTGATFSGLKAHSQRGSYFYPSYDGGIYATLGSGHNQVKHPWDSFVVYKRLEALLIGDTVKTRWRMKYAGESNADSIDYSYRLHISGRTLVIRVEVEGQSTKASQLSLSRSESTPGAVIVRVPYLTLFNVLYYGGSFTSVFFDWEVTNASRIIGFNPDSCCGAPWSSRWYSQCAYYDSLTDGTRLLPRRPLKETVYLTVSSKLLEVLPNLPGPEAPRKSQAARRTVLWYHPPYPWSIAPSACLNRYSYLDSLKRLHVDSVAVIMATWGKKGFSRGLPDVLPANTFFSCNSACVPENQTDANVAIRRARNYIVDGLRYSFGLYENYVDYYPTAGSGDHLFREEDCALDPTGVKVLGYLHTDCGREQAYVLKPGKAAEYASFWCRKIMNGSAPWVPIGPSWSYLDVHSSVNPSLRVDYDAGINNPGRDSAGMFLYTLHKYRELAGIVRNIYNGPVQGEGGNHFLYAGYYDDFEARIQTCDFNIYGYKAPLLIDFDLFKIHRKSALHGVGHYSYFYADPAGDNLHVLPMQTSEMLAYVATELAYGHGGEVTKYPSASDHTIRQAVLENQHVLPVYQDIANASPVSILYGEEKVDASRYIMRHPDYCDIKSNGFMSKVIVTYDNGVVVCVNRSASQWNVGSVGRPGGWFACNTLSHGLNVGNVTNNSFVLPARNGWVCYDPFRKAPSAPSMLSPSRGAANLQTNPVFKWNAVEGSQSYHIQISRSNSFSSSYLLYSDSNLVSRVWGKARLSSGRTYYWRVAANSSSGKTWSAPWRFSIASALKSRQN